MVETLLEDIFRVERLDPDGKKFDKVSRIEAISEQLEMYMQLDVNIDIYPLHVGEKFLMGGRKSLADKFEYVMHGKSYRISDASGPDNKVEICASFGGLLMLLKADPSDAQKLELDQRLFILIRKV